MQENAYRIRGYRSFLAQPTANRLESLRLAELDASRPQALGEDRRLVADLRGECCQACVGGVPLGLIGGFVAGDRG